ncbi:hypothetical protein [Paenibacillus sp. DMB5]|uniref:hypothetical protein n=1 Tax=Paenibacillus sp. DMB5 TaxID=1780103 RepID=UPI000A64C045|nr:hypothetical protein [Paenibacillus sp. DMB5]
MERRKAGSISWICGDGGSRNGRVQLEYSKNPDRAAEHYAYHTGQIVYASRWLVDDDEHLLAWKHYT